MGRRIDKMKKKKEPQVLKVKRSTVPEKYIEEVSRHIPNNVRLLLAVQAGGRCEFDGCNDYLFEHHVTLREGVFGQNAHIVAFKKDGPRGQQKLRPQDINNVENLMLLCHKCHKQIDDHPKDFSKEILESQKIDHETRIRIVTGMRSERKTAVLQFKAKVRAQQVDIPHIDIATAIAPRYPMSKRGFLIDLAKIDATGAAYIEMAKQEIDRKVTSFYETEEINQSRHASLFAIGPIPLLTYLGSKLSDKIPVDLFQRHRDTQDWTWKYTGAAANYETLKIKNGSDASKVALIISLSGKISAQHLPSHIDDTFSIFELKLKGQDPNTDFLHQREDLEGFRNEYRRLLATIVRDHPSTKEIHIFPAVPVPIAVSIGLDRLRQVQPSLIIYNHEGSTKGFLKTLRIDDYETK